jgi:hypothetical protein
VGTSPPAPLRCGEGSFPPHSPMGKGAGGLGPRRRPVNGAKGEGAVAGGMETNPSITVTSICE